MLYAWKIWYFKHSSDSQVASSLASDDVFILETPDNTYIWHGKGASDTEKQVAERIVQLVSPGVVALPLDEGAEPDKFWDALGGKGDYDTTLDPPGKTLRAWYSDLSKRISD